MKKFSSTSAAFWYFATLSVAGVARDGGPAISITPAAAQQVIAGAPQRFTGSVRVQSLFD